MLILDSRWQRPIKQARSQATNGAITIHSHGRAGFRSRSSCLLQDKETLQYGHSISLPPQLFSLQRLEKRKVGVKRYEARSRGRSSPDTLAF